MLFGIELSLLSKMPWKELIFGSLGFILLIVIVCVFLWYVVFLMLPFSKFPSFRMDIRCIYWIFSGKKFKIFIIEQLISFGKKCQSEGFFVLWLLKPVLVTFNEEAVKSIINDHVDKASEYSVFLEVFGEGLFTGDEILWRKRRKMFNPVFRYGMLKDKIPLFIKHSKKLVKELHSIKHKESTPVDHFLKNFSFDVLCESILGINFDDPSAISEREVFIDIVDKQGVFLVDRIFKPWLYFWKLFPSGREYLRCNQKQDELVRKRLLKIKEQFTSPKAGGEERNGDLTCKSSNKSLADVLLEHHVKDPSFTIDDMISEIKLFIIAGYDSVSNSINWCLYLLGTHPEIQDRVYEEMKPFTDGDLSFEDLQELSYTECVIMEALRLYPVIPVLARKLNKNVEIGRYKIPKGTSVAFFVYMYHRNPDIYPDPERFDPDRYLNGNLAKRPWTHITFSSGIRYCIGQKFAMMEMKIALVHILRSLKVISLIQRQDLKLIWQIILKNDEPLRMKLIPRHSIA